MQLVMMRHGATRSNEERRYAGVRTNDALSDAGRAQCLAAGVFPAVERVYTSPLLRTQQSAAICFPQAEIIACPGLEEYDFGVFEGRTADEMAHDLDYRAWVDSGCSSHCPRGDSRASHMERSNAALVQLLHEAARRGEDQVIVVGHSGTIMAAFHAFATDEQGVRLDRSDADYFNWHVPNTQGYTAQVSLGAQDAVAQVSLGARLTLTQCRRFETLPL